MGDNEIVDPPDTGPDQDSDVIGLNFGSPLRFTQMKPLRPGDLVRWRCTVRGHPVDFAIRPYHDEPLPVWSKTPGRLEGKGGRTPLVVVIAQPAEARWYHYRVEVPSREEVGIAGILVTPEPRAGDYPPYEQPPVVGA